MKIIDLGLMPYREAWELQRQCFNEMVEARRNRKELPEERIFVVEHPAVITLGKHARESNLLFPVELLGRHGIEAVRIERGGDVTVHSPGQIVMYPIIDLLRHHLGVKDYVHLLEETVIQAISEYGVKGERVEGASGVWVDAGSPLERKISALGVKCSHFFTMHGLALNVSNDLSLFKLINPCGFTDKGVTSLSVETKCDIPLEPLKKQLPEIFCSSLPR